MKELQDRFYQISKDHSDSHQAYGTQAPDVKGGPPTVNLDVQNYLMSSIKYKIRR